MKKLFLAFITLSLFACTSESEEDLFPPDPGLADSVKVSFRMDINPIIQRSCSGPNGCHSPGGIGPILLQTYPQIKTAVDNPNMMKSLLNRVVIARDMPLGGPELPLNERNLIKAWIERGAQNN